MHFYLGGKALGFLPGYFFLEAICNGHHYHGHDFICHSSTVTHRGMID